MMKTFLLLLSFLFLSIGIACCFLMSINIFVNTEKINNVLYIILLIGNIFSLISAGFFGHMTINYEEKE